MGNSRLKWWLGYAVILTVCFGSALVELVRLPLDESAYSHLILIPLISMGLLRRPLASMPADLRGAWVPATALGLLACLLLLLPAMGLTWGVLPYDPLSPRIAAYVLLLWAGGFASVGAAGMRRILFPVAFSLFFIPMPSPMVQGIERFLQHASAEAAHGMFLISGETFLRDGLVFQLPGLAVEVARECSGIRSTLILFITGVMAAKVLLKTPSRRVLLVCLILPIAILRNGFRVWLLATLTVHVNPEIIHSVLHRHGGPLFFLLSLALLLGITWWLMRSERPRTSDPAGRDPLAS